MVNPDVRKHWTAKMLGHRLAEPTSDPKSAVKVNLDHGSEASDRVAEDGPSWA
jgi:hypothetical protein